MSMVSSIMTVAFMMVIPALLGYLLDSWLGTIALFMCLGVLLGMVGGVWQLMKLVQLSEQSTNASQVKSTEETRE